MLRIFLAILLTFFMSQGMAKDNFTPLAPDKAFVFSTYLNDNNQLVMQWDIAPGYYLYRDALHFISNDASQVRLGAVELPPGTVHGKTQIYAGKIKINLPLQNVTKGELNLNISYRGCSSSGFCYAPINKNLSVDLTHVKRLENLTSFVQPAQAMPAQAEQNDYVTNLFGQHNLFIVVLSFMGLGLLLAFTPCVLPMVPILSGIIIGHGKKANRKTAFMLSLVYVLGMAIMYAIAGVVIALIGSSIQADLQRPWVIILFSGVFIFLALSLFGLYELELPSRWQQHVTAWSNRQKGGTYLGVFLMGCLSTLIVSPCVSAPLVGVLAYIGQTGNVILGALSLLALGIGMGIPLLLIGLSADRILPKAGLWMKTIERIFGFLMLAVAIWMLSRMIPGPITLFLWAILAIFAAVYVGVYSAYGRWKWIAISMSAVIFVYGIMLMVGAVLGGSDPFSPWAGISQPRAQSPFVTVQNMEQLDQQIKTHPRVMLDFYADWCTSCLNMDRTVFSHREVQNRLSSFVLLRADLTNNTAFNRAVLKRFNVIGPPTILFFVDQQELSSSRIVGEVNAKEFLTRIKKIEESTRGT